MKNLLTMLRYVPKHAALVTAIVVAGATAAASFAWGPSRTTYTMEHPADHVVFNSITNNPEYGDEREFLTVRDLTTGQTLGGSTTVVPGHEYLFQVYVHNNAASNFNSADYNYKGIARDTTVEAAVPTEVNGSADAAAYVRASNATSPPEVWDTVKLTSNGKVTLDYQEGSARLFTKAFSSGKALPDSLMSTSGAKVGYNALDGNWPGCLQYSGTVTFKVKAVASQNPNFIIEKTVRVNGATDPTFKESVSVKPGDKVDFQIYFKNTGNTQLTNVALRDALPTGMTYVAGSTWLHNSSGTRQVADGITSAGGIGIGGYLPDGNAYAKFTAQVVANTSLPACGLNALTNTASVDTDQGSKSDTAIVTTTKTCTNPPTTSCKAITPHVISRTEFSFDGEATVSNGATVSKYTFVVKNAAGTVVKTIPVSSTALKVTSGKITLATVGKYSVVLTVTTSLGDKTSTNCQTSVEVKPEIVVPKYTCDELTVTQISRTEFKFVVKKTVENATYLRTVFVVRTQSGTEVARFNDADGAYNYTRTAVGKYTVEAFIVVRVNGVDKTVTSAKCEKPFEVKAAAHPAVDIEKKVIDADGKLVDLRSVTVGTPFVYQIVVKNTGNVALKHVLVNDVAPDDVVFIKTDAGIITGTPEGKAWSIYVDLAVNESRTFKITAKVTTYVENQIVNTACVNASEVNPTHPDQSDDCDRANVVVPKPTMIKVCVLGTWEIKDIKQADFDATKHSKDLSDCTTKVCELSTKKIVVINKRDFDQSKFSTKLSDCDTTITPPIVIANTGTEMIAAGGLLGSSALGLGISSFMRSRSAVKSALSRR